MKPTKVLKSKYDKPPKPPKGERGRPVLKLDAEKIVEQIKANNSIVFMNDLCLFLGCSSQTVCNHFPKGSPENDAIIEALEANKTAVKLNLRKKWFMSNNPTTEIALYKLLATQEEKRALFNGLYDRTDEEVKATVIKLRID